MVQLKNEKGIALVTALCFTLISLGIIMMLLYAVTQGTKATGAYKRYKTALDASYGSVDLLQKDILPQMMNLDAAGIDTVTAQFNTLSMVSDSTCLSEKINKTSWDTTKCNASSKTAIANVSPDMTFNLKATNDTTGYKVYAKIIDTRCGGTSSDPCSNSDARSEGITGLVKATGTTSAAPQYTERKPAFYRIEVKGERASTPLEKSELSVLYAY